MEVAEATTMWGLLERRSDLTPDAPMLVDEHDRSVSFAAAKAWAQRVAAGLHEAGVGPGTAFTWQLPTRIETVILSMALARLGAVQNPVISLYRQREVASLLHATRAEWYAVLSQWRGFDYLAMAEAMQAESPTPFQVLLIDDGLPEGDPARLPPAPTDGDAVRWLYSTSGTTSEPKAVRHTDATLMAGGTGISIALQPRPDEMAALPFPFAHIGGPDQMCMTLRTGIPSLLMESFVPSEAVKVLDRAGATTLGGSTAHYLGLLQERRRDPDMVVPRKMRTLTGGGAPKPPEVYWQVKAELGLEIHHGYGMTECPMIAMGAIGDTDEQLAHTEGRPVHGCEIRVLDDTGNPAPAGVDGDLEVRGPMLAKGYTDPALTAESFRPDGWFRTGDRGHLRADGHVVVTGRTKELIIRKGENISPREIEDLLMTLPQVAAAAVIGLPDPERGELVCAVVEAPPSLPALTFAEMRAACLAAGLMPQKVPERLEVVTELPRNPTMKVLKSVLVERYSPTPVTGSQPQAGSTS
ncbi:acyl--CoA ligase [Acidiferrimicrobium sp. IK]|nr:acyl--CoA ligase [Acidiferrimicrobium sp. IK]